jgi:hypothetical protein
MRLDGGHAYPICHNALASIVGHVIARFQHLKGSSILEVALATGTAKEAKDIL